MKKYFGELIALGFVFAANPATAQNADSKANAAAGLKNGSSHMSRRYQTANVFDTVVGPTRRLGAAWFIRSKNSIQGRIMTNVPTAGDPYTLWLVIFNHPSACVDGCDAEDLGNPAVRGSVYNGSGAISAANGFGAGVVNIDFEILGDSLPKDLFVLVGDPKGLRRNKGFKAEVHLVVDQHPPIVPGEDSWIADLTTTNFPGMGAASSIAAAIFVACTDKSCPESVL